MQDKCAWGLEPHILKIDAYSNYIIKIHKLTVNLIQVIYKFPNGYGASIVMIHNTDSYELAMIKYQDDNKFTVVYTDIVGYDVVNLLTIDEIADILFKIINYTEIDNHDYS